MSSIGIWIAQLIHPGDRVWSPKLSTSTFGVGLNIEDETADTIYIRKIYTYNYIYIHYIYNYLYIYIYHIYIYICVCVDIQLSCLLSVKHRIFYHQDSVQLPWN